MKVNYFFMSLILFFASLTITKSKYPEKITYNEYTQLKKEFCFAGYTLQSKKSFLYLYYSPEGISVTYAHYDTLPDTLTENEKNLFLPHTNTTSNRKIYILHYGELPIDDSHDLQKFFRQKKIFASKKRSFISCKKPKKIDAMTMSHLLKNNSTLFYTSEGISDVWSYDNLINTMGINTEKFKEEPDLYCKIIVNNMPNIYNAFKKYCKEAITAMPTAAHLALATIIKKTNAYLCTDNIDLLHEQTGIKAHRFWKPKEKENISTIFSKKFDVVICIGLDQDTYAFLAWYKTQNPDGTIISINPTQPPYLGNEDFFISGDIQEILPKIAKHF